MKQYNYILLAIAGLLFIAQSCDYVDEPVVPQGSGNTDDCDTLFNFSNPQTSKKILVEEFTGHNCSNCPQAAHYLEELHDTYGDDLIVVGVHPSIGALTDPQSNPDGSYGTDWRIEEGQQLFIEYNMPGFIPIGMLGRTQNGSDYYHYHTTWNTEIPPLMGQTPDFSIQGASEYVSSSNVVCTKVEIEALNAYAGDVYLSAYLLEDSIVDYQKVAAGGEASGSVHPDYPAGDVANYIHRHVLRDVYGHVGIREGNSDGTGSIAGNLVAGNFSSGDIHQYVISFDNLDPSWNTDHLEVVLFVYDDVTKEILQAAKIKVN